MPLTWTRNVFDPYAGIAWERRTALITRQNGEVVFRQNDVEIPKDWSTLALNVVTQKYLRGHVQTSGEPSVGRETSVRQLIDRVVDTIAGWAGYALNGETVEIPDDWTAVSVFRNDEGMYATATAGGTVVGADADVAGGLPKYNYLGNVVYKRPKLTLQKPHEVYFANKESWEAWRDDLKAMLVNQEFCFNSPVWFNVGIEEHPQCSACFIVRMEDYFTQPGEDKRFTMDRHGIIAAQVKETVIFANGSGSGMNLSRVRGSKEKLRGGGTASGPLSFARGLDSWATVVKSGGKTRRAAKMLILDVDHPDIRDFIHVKAREERIAKTLIAAGYSADMDGEAYQHAFHQNSNLSARVSDDFMRRVDARGTWSLIGRSFNYTEPSAYGTEKSMIGQIGPVVEQVLAYDLMREIGQSCWESGDPGIQFSDTINAWNTCADEEPIFATNPCSEYVFLDETACNLGSLNLAKFVEADVFKVERFQHVVRAATIAMEVIVSNSRYPTESFARMSDRYRTLGVGFANLGGLLLRMGVPYDSDDGRSIGAVISSLMTSTVYAQSAEIASEMGPFPAFYKNNKSVLHVMRKHQTESKYLRKVFPTMIPALAKADKNWETVTQACAFGAGIRNAQATVIAPTGTIAFMMDCETTGIEPELALVKYKVLSGGGTLKIVNPLADGVVDTWLRDENLAKRMKEHLLAGNSPRTLPGVIPGNGYAEVMRTSFPPVDDPEFYLPWQAHIKMMAAVQPFISGAISKTVNMPENATAEEIVGAYTLAWHSGLKCVAVYRDNCKAVQPMSTSKGKADGGLPTPDVRTKVIETDTSIIVGARRKMPSHVPTIRCKFEIDGHKGYLHVGFFPDASWDIGEIFIKLSKFGAATGGFADAFCRLFSVCVQYGVPLEELYDGFIDTNFEPNGIVVDDPDVRSCRSIPDYIVQKLKAIQERAKKQNGLPIETTSGTYISAIREDMTKDEKIQVAKTSNRRSGKACSKCGSTDVRMVGKCSICASCGYEEGGCYQ